MKNDIIRYWASLITESQDILRENDVDRVNDLIEKLVKNDNGKIKYDDETRQQGTDLLASMETDTLNKVLVDYTTSLIDNTDVDTENNESIKRWRGIIFTRLTALWYMVFDVLKERELLLDKYSDLVSSEQGFGPEWLMDYVESTGGYSYKKLRSISNSYKVKLPSKDDIKRYIKSPHRSL